MPDFQIDHRKALQTEFYQQDTELIAKQILGKVLVVQNEMWTMCGEIVETEAYVVNGDLANHAAHKQTKRNAAMFEAGGIMYVYMIYGMYHCVNVVTEAQGDGCAVLIRAVRPLLGIEQMMLNRKQDKIKQLCSGPGKLAQAFGFTKEDNFSPLTSPKLFIQHYKNYADADIVATERIGIIHSKELPLRFYPQNCEWVSKK